MPHSSVTGAAAAAASAGAPSALLGGAAVAAAALRPPFFFRPDEAAGEGASAPPSGDGTTATSDPPPEAAAEASGAAAAVTLSAEPAAGADGTLSAGALGAAPAFSLRPSFDFGLSFAELLALGGTGASDGAGSAAARVAVADEATLLLSLDLDLPSFAGAPVVGSDACFLSAVTPSSFPCLFFFEGVGTGVLEGVGTGESLSFLDFLFALGEGEAELQRREAEGLRRTILRPATSPRTETESALPFPSWHRQATQCSRARGRRLACRGPCRRGPRNLNN